MKQYSNLLLLVSLVINIFLVGWLAGQWSGDKVGDYPVRDRGLGVMHEQFGELSEDKAQLVRERMSQAKRQGREVRRKIKTLRQDIIAILVAEEFDEEAYEAKTEELHEVHGEMARSMARATQSLAREFSLEDRQALAKHLQKRSPRHGPGGAEGRPPFEGEGRGHHRRPPPGHHRGPPPF